MTVVSTRRAAPLLASILLLAPPLAYDAAAQSTQRSTREEARQVFVNGDRLPENEIRALELGYRVRIADGRYWYDARSGAWGVESGPTAGLILPGLPLGGRLREDASAGRTPVIVNGRRLPSADLIALEQLTGPIQPGRYWVNANGDAGFEGGPAIVNLHALAARSQSNAWSHYTRSTDASVGGDGDFFYYIDRNTSMTGGR